jgi:multiple antibiotic resistance protein
MSLSLSLWSAFVTLFVTMGPVETGTIFASLTAGIHSLRRKSLAARAVILAGIMLLVFALFGSVVLSVLHVSLSAFRIAGCILLFLQALTLTFSASGLSSINEGEQREAEGPGDIAVFPLSFPLIASPGSLSAVVLLMGRNESALDSVLVLAMLAINLALPYGAMLLSGHLTRLLGKTGSEVVGRISGVLLAALAVQIVLDGRIKRPSNQICSGIGRQSDLKISSLHGVSHGRRDCLHGPFFVPALQSVGRVLECRRRAAGGIKWFSSRAWKGNSKRTSPCGLRPLRRVSGPAACRLTASACPPPHPIVRRFAFDMCRTQLCKLKG